MNPQTTINEKWIKASILGTTWAASEIVLGSFLHNLRIPLSSTILTGIGIVILISSSYIWKEKGLFWRAGLICALMKTMSPSAVIFGPMIAIFSQALLMELGSRILGRNIFGFTFGAILAMSWNLFQKIMNLIIFYSFGIVDLYSDILKFAQKQLSIKLDLVWSPIIFLFFIYLVAGLTAAFIGIRVGKRIKEEEHSTLVKQNAKISKDKRHPQNFPYSLLWLSINLTFIIGGMLLLNFSTWHYWVSGITIISFIWVRRYRRALRQLMKPRLWILFVIITMLTALAFSISGRQSWQEGLLIGLQMNFRAVLIILGFSVLGTELYNPKIRAFFMRTSLKQLPFALELSFSHLPTMLATVPDLKHLLQKPVSVIHSIIANIDQQLEEIKKQKASTIFLITAGIDGGKTQVLEKTIVLLKEKGLSIGGIISEKVVENGDNLGYYARDIQSGERERFLLRNEKESKKQIGRFKYLNKGLQFGLNTLSLARTMEQEIIVIDEVGKLELTKRGWHAAAQRILQLKNKVIVLTVRDRYLEEIIQSWNLQNPVIIEPRSTTPEILSSKITNKLQTT